MSVKVSVVVATYNSPPELAGLVQSLDEQTLPADEYELIFVDDGSSDDTHDRLTALAADRTNMQVHRIPNSGWPGRPRNVGTRAATGEFVFYADHDDYLFPEALERMYAFAVDNDLDVVHPKEVVKGWGRPGWFAYRHHRPRVDRLDQVVVQNISPHTLYRRSFVHEKDVWFPEGRIRLEDFSLNGLAWSRTDAIGVLADYPCYQWSVHQDNSHKASYDYDVYWASFEESLAPILELEEGDKRDQLLIRWYRSRILERVKTLHKFPVEHVDRLLATWEHLMPLFPPHLDAQMNPSHRARSALLRAGDRPRMLALAELDTGHRFRRESGTVRWDDAGRLVVDVRAVIVDGTGEPLPVEVVDGRVRRVVPPELAAGLDPALWDFTADVEHAFAELIVRSRETAVDWIVPATSRVWVEPGPDRLSLSMTATLDLATAAGGRPLEDEVWDVFFRLVGIGYAATRRVFLDPGTPIAGALVDGRGAVAFQTRSGDLALDLSGQHRTVVGAATATPADVTTEPGQTRIGLHGVHVTGETELPATVGLRQTEHPARLVGHAGTATLEIDGELVGNGEVKVTVAGKTGGRLFRLGPPPRRGVTGRLPAVRRRVRALAHRLRR
jgi:glycosyltransferase involved in cell wall biosynthesis